MTAALAPGRASDKSGGDGDHVSLTHHYVFHVCPVRISAHVDHPFRWMSITHFGACRSPVSVHVDQPFRSMSIT